MQLIEDYSLVSFIPLNIQVPGTKRLLPLAIGSDSAWVLTKPKSTLDFEDSKSGLCPKSDYHFVPLVLGPGAQVGRTQLKRMDQMLALPILCS